MQELLHKTNARLLKMEEEYVQQTRSTVGLLENLSPQQLSLKIFKFPVLCSGGLEVAEPGWKGLGAPWDGGRCPMAGLESDDFEGPPQPKPFHDSVICAHTSFFWTVQCSCSLLGEGAVLAASPTKDFVPQIKRSKV